jgi:hypothetical protein
MPEDSETQQFFLRKHCLIEFAQGSAETLLIALSEGLGLWGICLLSLSLAQTDPKWNQGFPFRFDVNARQYRGCLNSSFARHNAVGKMKGQINNTAGAVESTSHNFFRDATGLFPQ